MSDTLEKNPGVSLSQEPGGKSPAIAFEELRLDLHNLARQLMKQERREHTLQPTALLNEAWISVFAGQESVDGADRAQLIARAARAMRHILIDHARRRGAAKRGGDYRRVPLDDVLDRCTSHGLDAIEFEEALSELGKVHPRPALAMTLRFIAGLEIAAIAAQLDLSTVTIRNDLDLARAWLRRKLLGSV